MFDRIDPGRAAPAMGEDLPPISRPAGIHARHDALAAETLGDLGDQFGPFDRRAVDSDLVRACQQQRARILGAAHAATHGQRHEADRGSAPDDVEQRPAPFVAGGNIEEAQFVGARRIVGLRLLDRIARILQIDEIDALDHAAIRHVEAGDHADADGHRPVTRVLPLAGPSPAPLLDPAARHTAPAR